MRFLRRSPRAAGFLGPRIRSKKKWLERSPSNGYLRSHFYCCWCFKFCTEWRGGSQRSCNTQHKAFGLIIRISVIFMKILLNFWMKSSENFSQSLKKFYSIFEKISLNFRENFTQFLRKFYPIFNKISHNSQENFSQFLKEFHSNFWIFTRILRNFKVNLT